MALQRCQQLDSPIRYPNTSLRSHTSGIIVLCSAPAIGGNAAGWLPGYWARRWLACEYWMRPISGRACTGPKSVANRPMSRWRRQSIWMNCSGCATCYRPIDVLHPPDRGQATSRRSGSAACPECMGRRRLPAGFEAGMEAVVEDAAVGGQMLTTARAVVELLGRQGDSRDPQHVVPGADRPGAGQLVTAGQSQLSDKRGDAIAVARRRTKIPVVRSPAKLGAGIPAKREPAAEATRERNGFPKRI